MLSGQLTEQVDSLSTKVPTGHSNRANSRLQTNTQETADLNTLNAPEDGSFPQKLLNVGFSVALVLAGICLITGALYLNSFMKSTNQGIESLINGVGAGTSPSLPPDALYTAINARLAMAKIALLSCGVFIGMSFGFLGFALFLIGIRQEMNATGRYEGYYVKLSRLSPGVFVIVCASILIGICVTHEIPFSYRYETSQSQSNANSQQEETPKLPPIDMSKPKTR